MGRVEKTGAESLISLNFLNVLTKIAIMFLFLLGIIDILAGASMVFPNFLGFYLGIAVALKGLSSLLGFASGDVGIAAMGLIDIATGIMLLTGFIVPWFWLIVLIKGIFSLASGIGS